MKPGTKQFLQGAATVAVIVGTYLLAWCAILAAATWIVATVWRAIQ